MLTKTSEDFKPVLASAPISMRLFRSVNSKSRAEDSPSPSLETLPLVAKFPNNSRMDFLEYSLTKMVPSFALECNTEWR